MYQVEYTFTETTQTLKRFMYRVYGWMSAGLIITTATAYTVYSVPAVFNYIFKNPAIFFTLIIAQFGVVIVLSGLVKKLSAVTATTLFIIYSALTGLTLASLFAIYTLGSIYLTFAIAAGMFLTMAIYGYVTQEDLTSIGTISTMGLFGVIIALFVNFFLQSSQFDYIISLIGVAVFTMLTAYDTQKIKQLGNMMIGQGEMEQVVAIRCALTLYLDFVNLFLFLLRLFGRRND